MKDNFTTREIVRHLGCTERQLVHWADRGFVSPLVDAEGLGSRRQYTAKNVFEIAVINTLWGKVDNKIIKRVLEWLSVYKNKPEEVAYMIITGEDVHPVRRDYVIFFPKMEKINEPGELSPSGLTRRLHIPQVEIPDLSILVDAITKHDLALVLNLEMVREKAKGLVVS